MKRIFLLLAGMLSYMSLQAAETAQLSQTRFTTAEQAADSFVLAVARRDATALNALLGDDYRSVLPIDEINPDMVDRFLDGWAAFHSLLALDDSARLLSVGHKGWTLPIPIVRDSRGWRFDTVAGREMMRVRRIGRNELAVMQAALAYHDAQIEYASQDRDGDGQLEYARQFISDPDTHNGLYWEAPAGQPQSPLGPLFSEKLPTGNYHGYHYRILTAQGEHAPGGAENYLVNGHMTGGFGLIAWPADYGQTGVMSFIIGQNGELYEADLGPETNQLASAITAFDPDASWSPVAAEFTAANL